MYNVYCIAVACLVYSVQCPVFIKLSQFSVDSMQGTMADLVILQSPQTLKNCITAISFLMSL